MSYDASSAISQSFGIAIVMNKEEMLDSLVGTGLYLVTEDAVSGQRRLDSVAQALSAGARVIQLRDKRTPRRVLLEEAKAMKALCSDWRAAFLVNDDVALAWSCEADGVHVGQDDLPASEARRLLGSGKLIGLSVSALSEAEEADRLPIDYIGVGAINATPTKTDAELGGIDLLRQVRLATKKPLVAIGGIDASNAAEIFEAGADGIAVVRGVFAQPDIPAAVRRLLEIARVAREARRKR